jgi:hypothetical protein
MKKLFVSLVLLVMSACASPADDLDSLCDETTKLQSGEGEYAELTPAQKASTYAKNVDARIKSTEMQSAWDAIASAAPDQKYSLMQDAAAAAGVTNWQCPALEEFWGQQAAPPAE